MLNAFLDPIRERRAEFAKDPQAVMQGGAHGVDTAKIEGLIQERAQAKQNKDFARADAIRQELLAQDIVLEDKPGGQTLWRKA